jgi:hypothetical protein
MTSAFSIGFGPGLTIPSRMMRAAGEVPQAVGPRGEGS